MNDLTKAVVLQPEDGDSYWQPIPANGHVINKLDPANWDGPFSLGLQFVAPNAYIRRHTHDRHKEVLFVWGGRGRAEVDGENYKLQPGTVIGLPAGVEHMLVNEGEEDLRFLWILAPHGLEEFFRQIGRPRRAGEDTPAPFPRPADVAAIEAATVFKPS